MRSMKKVLLVTHVGDFIPQFEMNNVRCLQKMGYEVHYAANFNLSSYGNKGERLKNSGVICHYIPFERSPFRVENIQAYRCLAKLLTEHKFSLIHCHTPMGGVLARLAGRKYRRRGTKILYTAHGFHFFKGAPRINWMIYYPVEKFLSRFTDVQITINQEDYERARRFHAKKVVKIPGVGIDTEALGQKVLENRSAFRQELGIADQEVCLLSVGELDENKNHKTVIEALKQMDRTGIHYLICGQGELKEQLEKQIDAAGLSDTVKLLGYRNDIASIYEAADILVFPSHREGLSAALMEAMAKGLPVVASKIRGNVDLIEEGKGGYLVDSRKPEEFAKALTKLCADKECCGKMGEHNRRAVAPFDVLEARAVMKKVYEEVLR